MEFVQILFLAAYLGTPFLIRFAYLGIAGLLWFAWRRSTNVENDT